MELLSHVCKQSQAEDKINQHLMNWVVRTKYLQSRCIDDIKYTWEYNENELNASNLRIVFHMNYLLNSTGHQDAAITICQDWDDSFSCCRGQPQPSPHMPQEWCVEHLIFYIRFWLKWRTVSQWLWIQEDDSINSKTMKDSILTAVLARTLILGRGIKPERSASITTPIGKTECGS